MPYLGPNSTRRERELQIAEVRAVAASHTARLATRAAAKRNAAAVELSSLPPTASVEEFLADIRTDLNTSFPYASPYDRLFIDYCQCP